MNNASKAKFLKMRLQVKKKILYFDMDGVLVNFYSHPTAKICPLSYNDPQIYQEGFFFNLKPTYGALHAVDYLTSLKELDVYILTHGLAGSSHCYSEKVQWIQQYLPQLTDKIIITCDKNLNKGDILIDDSSKWSSFDGKFVEFTPSNLLNIQQTNISDKTYKAMWAKTLEIIKGVI